MSKFKDKSQEYLELKANPSSKYYYQIKLSKEINNKLLNNDDKIAGMLVLPTGGGKTRIAVTTALDNAMNNGYKILWIAHRHMLLDQAKKTFQEFSNLIKQKLSIKIISGKHNPIESIDKKDNVIIIGNLSMGLRENPDHIVKKTLKNRVFTKDQKWLIIVDEAHHSLSKSYKEWIGLDTNKSKRFGWLRKHRKENIKILGLTATPNFTVKNKITPYDENRTRELSALYDNNTIGSISTQQLIDSGVLSRPNIITIGTKIDFNAEELLSKVENIKPSLEDSVLEMILNEEIAKNEERNQLIVKRYLEGYNNIDFTSGQTLVFASNITNAMALKEAFKIKNVSVDAIYSNKSNNNEIINDFRSGKIKVLINVQILTEGSDIPEIQNIFISRITGSKVLFRQMVGRALRGVESGGTETANIVTFKDNILNHHSDFFDTQKFEKGLFEETDNQTTPTEENEYVKFSENDITNVYEKFIGLLDGDVEIPLVSAIPIGYYDLDEEGYKLNVYDHQLEYFINFIKHYNKDNSIVNLSHDSLKSKYFNTKEMLFAIVDEDIRQFVNYIKEIDIPEFVNFEFKAKLINELKAIAEKTSDMLVLEDEFKNSTYAKDFYSVKQFVKECQEIARNLRYGAEPLKEIEIKEDEQVRFIFDDSVHDKEKIFKNASDKICRNLGIEKLQNSPKSFEWTKKAYKSYWGMAYFADGFSKRDDNTKIEINKILQLKEIDSKIIESVVYHELLHTELKICHTPEFRRYEAMFPDFEECEHILYKISMGIIDSNEDELKSYKDWSYFNKDKTYTLDEVKKILQDENFILPKLEELSELVKDGGKFHNKSCDEELLYFISNDLKSGYTQFRSKQNNVKDKKITLIVKKKKV